jgi:predicted dehydrogenase
MPRGGLRWGVAGYGDLVRRRGLPGLAALGADVTRVWGRDRHRADALCREFGAGRGTDDVDVLVDASDVVYVATPVSAHLPIATAALRAGRPVLIEKPLGVPALLGATGAPPRELTSGPVAAVAYYRRLAPALVRLRELLAGRAVHAVTVAHRSAFDPAADDPRRWRTDPAVAGGGVLADIGSHRLDLLRWLLGEPERLAARVGPRFAPGAERAAQLRLTWRSGARADLGVSWEAGRPHDRMALLVDGGHLVLDPLDSGHLRGRLDGTELAEHHPPAANPHLPLLADFARSVRDGGAPACPVVDAIAVDLLLAAAYATATADPQEPR